MVMDKLKLPGLELRGGTALGADRSSESEPKTFPQLLEYARRKWGDKIAFQQKVRRDWRRLTYVDVDNQSRELAAGLLTFGVNKGDRVAIIAENGLEWVCAYYSIVMIGCVAVPIYYDLQAAEVDEALNRSGATIAYVSPKSLEKFEGALRSMKAVVVLGEVASTEGVPNDDVPNDFRRSTRAIVEVETLVARGTPENKAAVAATIIEPDDLASIVFTSGTSGGMKGVMLTHRNFMANLQQVRKSIPMNNNDRIAIVLPMHHTFPFTMSMAVAPFIGGEITFENDLRRIRDRMAEVKPTFFLGVPQLFEVMWRNILHSIEVQGRMDTFHKGMRIAEATKKRTGVNIGRIVFRELHARLGGSLRFAVSGAAPLNPQIAHNFAKIGLPIIQGWGLTEASPCLAAVRWNPRKFYLSSYYEDRFGMVGPALEGVEVALIDVPEKELYVHLHGEGELIARGDNITPGYWQGEEATAAAKVGDWLRTGDIGRIDDEGNIWITGRSKFVIVLDSGEKIHPDDLEGKLELSPFIEDVAVIGKKVRGKTQAWAIVYPNRDRVLERLAGQTATEDAVRGVIKAAIDEQEENVAPFKRTTDFMLTDVPLPRTAGLRKVARGQIGDNYTFDPARWAESWPEHLASIAAPGADDPSEESEAVGGAVAD